MSRFSTFNFLINSYYDGMKEFDFLHDPEAVFDEVMNTDEVEFEPSPGCVNAVMKFASQYEVLKSETTGTIELNLN